MTATHASTGSAHRRLAATASTARAALTALLMTHGPTSPPESWLPVPSLPNLGEARPRRTVRLDMTGYACFLQEPQRFVALIEGPHAAGSGRCARSGREGERIRFCIEVPRVEHHQVEHRVEPLDAVEGSNERWEEMLSQQSLDDAKVTDLQSADLAVALDDKQTLTASDRDVLLACRLRLRHAPPPTARIYASSPARGQDRNGFALLQSHREGCSCGCVVARAGGRVSRGGGNVS